MTQQIHKLERKKLSGSNLSQCAPQGLMRMIRLILKGEPLTSEFRSFNSGPFRWNRTLFGFRKTYTFIPHKCMCPFWHSWTTWRRKARAKKNSYFNQMYSWEYVIHIKLTEDLQIYGSIRYFKLTVTDNGILRPKFISFFSFYKFLREINSPKLSRKRKCCQDTLLV